MRKLPKQYLQGSAKSQFALATILIGALACVGFVLWWFYENTQMSNQPETATVEQANQETEPATAEVAEEPSDKFNNETLQAVVDSWISSLGSPDNASVVIADVDGVTLAKTNPAKLYFAASIYKLYVAYEGYRAVDSGAVDPGEIYLNGHTRLECLDLMIRNSDSPCAEKLWVELGKENLTVIMKSYGLNDTSLVGLSTTAQDAASMTARIARGEGLSSESRANFLASMKGQIYRDSLNKGFSSGVTVYNKIGFNELLEYHDVALVEFADGRQIVVAVLTSGVGTRNIAALGASIEAAVLGAD